MRRNLLLATALLCGMLGIQSGFSQVLNAPQAAPNQTPPAGTTTWTAACASPSFNDYWVEFTWSPPLVNSDNEFILELSDASGDFSAPVELARDGTKNTNFDFYFQFAVPPNTRGEGYRMRVRSTSPANTSPVSAAYPMYFLDVNSALTIRPQGQADFGDGTAQVCNGNAITLEVYGLPNANTYQYNWYRSGTLLSQKTPSISVTQGGMYNVEIDYGSCSGSGNTLSNLLDVTTGSSLGVAINPPASTALCAGETALLEANITGQGLTYTWFKDGTAVSTPAVDDSSFLVDASSAGFEGDYQVEIFGASACIERSAAITITNAGNFTVSRNNPANLVVLPGQTVTMTASSSASGVTYQWYKDGTAVPGATSASLTVNESETGVYFARVSLSGGSCASSSKDTESTSVSAPASLELEIAFGSGYLPCEATSTVLEVAEVRAIDAGGNRTVVTSQILGDMNFQWMKDGSPISGATGSSISLTDTSENGAYSLEGSISGYLPVSNILDALLRPNETIAITSTDLTVCGPSEPVTLTTTRDLTGETYDWYRNGSPLNENTPAIDVGLPGSYQLILERDGCQVQSNAIVLSPLDEDLISLVPGDDIRLPEGTSQSVSATGGDSYRWFDENNNEIGASATITLSEAGEYVVMASIGNCQVFRTLTVSYLDTFRVPNVISVNGDGINEQWILPNYYSGKTDVFVTIYNDKGEEVLNQNNYQNNWPSSSAAFSRQNMIFYYRIRNAEKTLKQGTITVIR
ncbi:immunoglobulin domain-containing protein [Robiginitalea aurantiaca]|uniref:Immunoglobulin domain-containing protein n=1 Tax=Robiginitalea aurantiaca TaxID=3056915 RepID=A0ABT7WAC6_9FLAO|nr:immunoglobulin domain-containing protein [Robiginitalea aurantiaca]MDM9629868.1 immunoglobulin domain-containing protein [Robiginitalea aurantiaca]